MNTEWSLDELYKGLDDAAYEADIAALEKKTNELGEMVAKARLMDPKEAAEQLLRIHEERWRLFYHLDLYLELRQSVNTGDGEVMAQISRLQKISAKAAKSEAAMKKILAEIVDVDAMAAHSEIIKAYTFWLKENKEQTKHLLTDEEEEMVSALNMTGGAAWRQLFSYLTSTVKVDYANGQTTLSQIRNLAYSPKQKVRKEAYEAELASYEKIQDSLAFSLNNIKAQVSILCEKRGYASPLAMTLAQSRMSQKTLDAMMKAIEEYLPVFHSYLKKKARLLGYQKGLPWFELFAPVGKSDQSYTLEEAKKLLLESFSSFSPDMEELMKEAFEDDWIDFYPKKGKTGGAFCAGVFSLKQSRILTNFDGYFGSVSTLAHELGHAYHNRQLEGERPLNQDYPMPVAETASIFNELHLAKNALRSAKGEERLRLLESVLMEQTQSIVDIYSRYLFETTVFEKGKEQFLMAEDLKKLMLLAQKEAYGDGLDVNCLHPYMWACKSHYFNAGLSFYNFPYAFGNLLAAGLYSRFEKEGKAFVPSYREMLKKTSACSVEEAGALAGIDLTTVDFWCESLAQIAKQVEEFCKA